MGSVLVKQPFGRSDKYTVKTRAGENACLSDHYGGVRQTEHPFFLLFAIIGLSDQVINLLFECVTHVTYYTRTSYSSLRNVLWLRAFAGLHVCLKVCLQWE